MGTRCMIGVPRPSGMIGAVYCHSDGYPEGPWGVGHILATHWSDLTKARKLYEHGGMSFLGEELGHKHKLFVENLGGSDCTYNGCGFYTRDDGRPIRDARKLYVSREAFEQGFLDQDFDSAYAYLHDGTRWLGTIGDTDALLPLGVPPVAMPRYPDLVVRHRTRRVRRAINLED